MKFIFALEAEALWDQHCHEFATKPDAVALLATSHDCKDEEYVDGSAISPATVYVAGLNTNWNFQ